MVDFGIPTNVTPPMSFGQPTQSTQPAQNTQYQANQVQQANQYQDNQVNQANQTNQAMQKPAATGVNLQKGQKVSLSKMNPSLDNVLIGLGWDLSQQGGKDYDLDVEIFMLGSNAKVINDSWFVFYNNATSPDGSVQHCGDNKTGVGTGDDEIIKVQLSRVSPQVEKLTFVVTINEAKQRGCNFGQINNAYIRIVDLGQNKELVRFSLTNNYPTVVSMIFGELYKHNNEWRFNPVGEGTGDDLSGICLRYGVNI